MPCMMKFLKHGNTWTTEFRKREAAKIGVPRLAFAPLDSVAPTLLSPSHRGSRFCDTSFYWQNFSDSLTVLPPSEWIFCLCSEKLGRLSMTALRSGNLGIFLAPFRSAGCCANIRTNSGAKIFLSKIFSTKAQLSVRAMLTYSYKESFTKRWTRIYFTKEFTRLFSRKVC